MPNCKGGQIAKFGKKHSQVHLIIIREWPKNNLAPQPPILRNLDSFPSGAFYSTPFLPLPLQLDTKEY